MRDVATKPASTPTPPKVETKPADKPLTSADATPVEKLETKAVGKAENRQAGKGSKRRPFNARQFGSNYESIRWGKGHSQLPKH